MIRPSTAAIVGCFIAIIAASGGYIAGRKWPSSPDPLAHELRAQHDMLAAMLKRVSILSDARATTSPSSVVSPVCTAMDSATIEVAVRKAIEDSRPQDVKQNESLVPPDENAKAFSQCNQLFDHAIGGHRWTDADATKWRRLMGQLSAEQHSSLMERLAVAINDGSLAVQTTGRPF